MKYKKPVSDIHTSIEATAIRSDINDMILLPRNVTKTYIKNNYGTVKISEEEKEYVEIIYDVYKDNNLKYYYLCELVDVEKVIRDRNAYGILEEKAIFSKKINAEAYPIEAPDNWLHDPRNHVLDIGERNYNESSALLPLAPTRLYCSLYNATIPEEKRIIEANVTYRRQIIPEDVLQASYSYIPEENSWFVSTQIVTVDGVDYYAHSEAYYDVREETVSNESREYLNDYHCGVRPLTRLKEKEPQDRKGLHKFTIGFEVEKSEYPDSCEYDDDDNETYYVGQTPLYSHWERDSSCAIEGVTNVYSLNNLKRFEEDAKASARLTNYLDTSHSCGGHTNIGYNPEHIADFELSLYTIMPSVGILYSMFKRRLNNTYSCNNKKLNQDDAGRSYSVIRLKSNPTRLEFRLASAIKNTDQLIRRFKAFNKIMSHVYMRCMEPEQYALECQSMNTFLDIKYSKRSLYKNFRQDVLFQKEFFDTPTYKRTRWLLHDMEEELEGAYNGSNRKQRLAEVISDAYVFQSWLDEINLACTRNIEEYVSTGYYGYTTDIPEEEQINNAIINNTEDDSTSF